MYQIWNDKNGDRIEVGPDRDGLELIEIRQYTDDGNKPYGVIVMTREECEKLQEAIDRLLQ